jgi:hypothetical protein
MTTQTTTLPVSAKTLGTLFEFTYQVFRRNTEGITHEESLRLPQPGGNCMNWVGGHVVAVRDGLLASLGQTRVWSAAEQSIYGRKSPTLTDPATALPWERIVQDLEKTQERLRAGVAALTTERLASPMPAENNPFGVDSVGDSLAVFTFHESYHVGQLGILRRLAGKPGAIR